MNTYNLDALKQKITSLSNTNKKTSNEQKSKIKFWKPEIGTHEVRFLPLRDKDGNPFGQPFYEVAYYDNKDISEKRIVAPSQFGSPDPLKDMALELAKDRSKEAWMVRKKLTPRERFYAAILVRGGDSEKELQIWELSPKLCKDVYTLLVSPDYAEEDMFSLDNGYDFTVTVTPTDKTFNGYVVKEIKLLPRRKASKALPKKELVEAVMAQMPDFESFFKSQVKSEEEMIAIRDNFLAVQAGEAVGTEDANGTSRGDAGQEKALKEVDSAFADLEG